MPFTKQSERNFVEIDESIVEELKTQFLSELSSSLKLTNLSCSQNTIVIDFINEKGKHASCFGIQEGVPRTEHSKKNCYMIFRLCIDEYCTNTECTNIVHRN